LNDHHIGRNWHLFFDQSLEMECQRLARHVPCFFQSLPGGCQIEAGKVAQIAPVSGSRSYNTVKANVVLVIWPSFLGDYTSIVEEADPCYSQSAIDRPGASGPGHSHALLAIRLDFTQGK
jgi:hypothetical protein